eukprot:18804-Chlamydomonas_euryale.AAC.3
MQGTVSGGGPSRALGMPAAAAAAWCSVQPVWSVGLGAGRRLLAHPLHGRADPSAIARRSPLARPHAATQAR